MAYLYLPQRFANHAASNRAKIWKTHRHHAELQLRETPINHLLCLFLHVKLHDKSMTPLQMRLPKPGRAGDRTLGAKHRALPTENEQ
jgi:hypothetical protein